MSGLDTVILLRTNGNSDLTNFVLNGGRLVTEWDASWALNTAGLLDATDSGGGFIGSAVPVDFTAAGVSSGLAAGVNDPYSDDNRTDHFRNLTSIGSGVDVLATRPGGIPAIIGGQSGLGSTLIIGYDWADGFSIANADTRQLILNAVEFDASPDSVVPEPGSLALMGLGGIGMAVGALRRRLRKRIA